MRCVALIGANGFVGSAFRRLLEREPDVALTPVVRESRAAQRGQSFDVVIDAAGNSRRFFAEERPVEEFEASVHEPLRTLHEFPAALHLHISSVDVYADLGSPLTTREDTAIDVRLQSHYGFHKLLAEQVVRHYARRWLIVRLAGMVGPGLRKNPVFDLLHGAPLRIHPDSQYQFMHTDVVARIVWDLVAGGVDETIINVCGEGLVSPRQIAAWAGVTPDLSLLAPDATPRVVHASVERLRAYGPAPSSADAVRTFVGEHMAGAIAGT
jgi:nucleoside-diphosphate-sugar epimerase